MCAPDGWAEMARSRSEPEGGGGGAVAAGRWRSRWFWDGRGWARRRRNGGPGGGRGQGRSLRRRDRQWMCGWASTPPGLGGARVGGWDVVGHQVGWQHGDRTGDEGGGKFFKISPTRRGRSVPQPGRVGRLASALAAARREGRGKRAACAGRLPECRGQSRGPRRIIARTCAAEFFDRHPLPLSFGSVVSRTVNNRERNETLSPRLQAVPATSWRRLWALRGDALREGEDVQLFGLWPCCSVLGGRAPQLQDSTGKHVVSRDLVLIYIRTGTEFAVVLMVVVRYIPGAGSPAWIAGP